METEEYPIGGPLTREYFRAMLSKTEDIVPPSNIREVRTSHLVACAIMRFDTTEELDSVGPKDWPKVEGHKITCDINYREKSITITREDGLKVSFPVEC